MNGGPDPHPGLDTTPRNQAKSPSSGRDTAQPQTSFTPEEYQPPRRQTQALLIARSATSSSSKSDSARTSDATSGFKKKTPSTPHSSPPSKRFGGRWNPSPSATRAQLLRRHGTISHKPYPPQDPRSSESRLEEKSTTPRPTPPRGSTTPPSSRL